MNFVKKTNCTGFRSALDLRMRGTTEKASLQQKPVSNIRLQYFIGFFVNSTTPTPAFSNCQFSGDSVTGMHTYMWQKKNHLSGRREEEEED